MTIYKCDRCGVECEPRKASGYEFCEKCYLRFIGFLNQTDFTSDDVLGVLIGYGQKDRRFRLGETIKYSPTEVKEILDDVVEVRNGKHKNISKNGKNSE